MELIFLWDQKFVLCFIFPKQNDSTKEGVAKIL